MTLLVLLRNLDVAFLLLSLLGPADLMQLRLSCSEMHYLIDYLISRFYNIDSILINYFPDLPRFRQLQAATNTLISGSTALQVFSRMRWSDSDLDLYVFSIHAQTVANWLLSHDYVLVKKGESSENGNNILENVPPNAKHPYAPSVRHVATFKRIYAGSMRTIQVIVAVNSPLACVLSFHSSTYILLSI